MPIRNQVKMGVFPLEAEAPVYPCKNKAVPLEVRLECRLLEGAMSVWADRQ